MLMDVKVSLYSNVHFEASRIVRPNKGQLCDETKDGFYEVKRCRWTVTGRLWPQLG